MPLSMTLNKSNNIPLIRPYFNGKELHVDSDIINAGLSVISMKGYDAGDPKGEAIIRHRNSFWSVHRPELAKLSWATNYTSQNIENYLKIHAENQHPYEESEESNMLPEHFNRLTVIHPNSDQYTEMDEGYLPISALKTTQFSDDDLASHTILHKSRAEFCVTIGGSGEKSFSSNTSESFGSQHSCNNENLTADPISYKKPYKNLDEERVDKKLLTASPEMLITSTDDSMQR